MFVFGLSDIVADMSYTSPSEIRYIYRDIWVYRDISPYIDI